MAPRSKAAALLATLALPFVSQAAMYEPPGNTVYLGIWPQTEDPSNIHPNAVNPLFQQPQSGASNLNISFPIWQIAQQIPRLPYNYTTGAGGPAPEYLIEQTLTDAMVYLTVYPSTIAAVGQADLELLGNQILDYQTRYNRTVFLRFGPEMQGAWNPGYGQQPTGYVALWRTMYATIKQIAPLTAIIWAPNLGTGYPYGQTLTTVAGTTAADRTLLDTNNNGELDAEDDPYMPYYPGDAYVDWIGLSVYYKGLTLGNTNEPQNPGFCTSVLQGTTRGNQYPLADWYDRFCAQKPDKACLIAESGAAWHKDSPPLVTQVQYQQTWWRDCITNTTYLDLHPRLKMLMHFEYEKTEYDGGVADDRDYRITFDPAIRAAFIEDLAPVQNRFTWANYRALPSVIPSAGRPTADLPGQPADATTTAIVFQTARNTHTTFPQLFGVSGATSYRPSNFIALSAALGVIVMGGITGGLFVSRSRRA